MRRALVALAAVPLLALVGCSGSGGATTAPSSAAPAPAGTAPPSAPASPSLATLPAEQCLTGTWQLVRFVGASDQTYGTGQGGDVTVRFADGGYTLQGAGQEPLTITLGGGSADLTVDGRATGTFTVDGATGTFRQRSASGSAELAAGSRKERLGMDQITSVVGLEGEGQVACTPQAMTVTLTAVRLELSRA
ncbi:hypothetical protein SAMN04488544_1592 [Microlunatus sagamiharensis]|uniref:Lipocalin-like domain-containing protein n=1 Tax=Microlunatus sagamiharensis TaxID=546874 RepID=A0A1H2M8W2_9ACTN|nr:hypothetical protein [Microlunatus sagamiharensis]SDU89552.1 hypothetical protein SAMN04488544_1592 [Microlunatus sagamiharensis]